MDFIKEADIVVVGGGVVGCAILRELSRYNVKCVLLEKEPDIACGTTKANSAILHAGFDAPTGSMKAITNVLGNRLYHQLEDELDLDIKWTGSLVVAVNDEEVETLKELLERGKNNGVQGLEILNREQVLEKEPNLTTAVAALWAPSAGVCWPFEAALRFAQCAVQNGAEVIRNCRVTGFVKEDGKIAAVVDGGRCGLGCESTIIDMSSVPYKILRQGVLPEADIASVLTEGLKVIGITGGTGCGKTTALRELEAMGALIIDCDALYHDMLKTNVKMLADIERSFPGTVIDGVLDRKALGATVFSNEAALEDLNAITHHYIGLEVSKKLSEWAMRGGKTAAIDAIALLESGLGEKCCAVVGIVAEKTTRIERIMKRDGISYEYAMMRVNAQYPNEYFEQKCEYVLHNDGSEDKFRKECKNLFKEVLKNG